MAKLLRVRVSTNARERVPIDLGNTLSKNGLAHLPCRISGLPIYAFDLSSEEDVSLLQAGRIDHAHRVGWRYFAVFEGGDAARPPALIDYARRSSRKHRLWKLDHSGQEFVTTLMKAAEKAKAQADTLRFAPRLLLLPEIRWSAIWMAEDDIANDFVCVEQHSFINSETCASLILDLYAKQPRTSDI